ncbi:MAG: protein kinase, partial [Planctomycetaceae bacterium]|nr:protein kinase [Planctomycetaceae bacterium]
MTMATVEQFLQHLMESKLFSEEALRTLSERMASMDSSEDARTICDELVKEKKLTTYQAEAIYQGHTQRLVIGRNYVIEDLIGSGGMGMVFRARHQRMRRIVALKVLTSQAMNDEDAIKRFYQEVQVAATLDHKNIVRAYDADESNGVHYLVMEYVRGNDLLQIVQREGTLAVGQAVNCMIQAAEGLAHAHRQHIIHRDIKPANLLLNEEGLVKILDMGLARINNPLNDPGAQENLTLPGSIMGTVDFMGPEQAADTTKADARSDIYSLGCTLFFILIGRPVYEGSTAMVKLINHREAAIPSLCELRDDVSPELDSVFQKMIAKDPDARYQTMHQVIDALKPCRTESEEKTRETVSQFIAPHIRNEIFEDFQNTTTGKKSDTNIQKPGQSGTKPAPMPSERVSPSSSQPGAVSLSELEKDLYGEQTPETVDVSSPVGKRRKKQPTHTADQSQDVPVNSLIDGSITRDESQTVSTSSTLNRLTQSDSGQTFLLFMAAVIATAAGLAVLLLQTTQMLLALFGLAAVMVLILLFRPRGRQLNFVESETGNTVPPSSSRNRRREMPPMREPLVDDPSDHADESEQTLDAKMLFDEEKLHGLRESFAEEAGLSTNAGQDSYTESDHSITRRRVRESNPADVPASLISPYDADTASAKRNEWAEFLGIPAEMVNSVGTRMVLIPAGEFLMGSPQSEEGHVADEEQHPVRITHPYFLASHPVTVGEFSKFVDSTGYRTDAENEPKGGFGFNGNAGKMEQLPNFSWRDPGFAQSETHPVVNITWNDATAFCEWLSKRERITYRLPTEAEWEFACR